MTVHERFISYVAVALAAGCLVALVVRHEGPFWVEAPPSTVCVDSWHMTCGTDDEDSACAPGAVGTVHAVEVETTIRHRCLALLCQCHGAIGVVDDAGAPDVSLDTGAADGA